MFKITRRHFIQLAAASAAVASTKAYATITTPTLSRAAQFVQAGNLVVTTNPGVGTVHRLHNAIHEIGKTYLDVRTNMLEPMDLGYLGMHPDVREFVSAPTMFDNYDFIVFDDFDKAMPKVQTMIMQNIQMQRFNAVIIMDKTNPYPELSMALSEINFIHINDSDLI